MKNLLYICCCIILLPACADLQITYDMSIQSVERPRSRETDLGEISTSTIKRNGKLFSAFEDNLIAAQFFYGDKDIELLLVNKFEQTVKLNWDNAAWVDTDGRSMRLIHSGIRLNDKNAPQAPSLIPKLGTLNVYIVPANNLWTHRGVDAQGKAFRVSGWETLFDLQVGSEEDEETRVKRAQANVGKSCAILLPIEVDGHQYDYVFHFKLGNVRSIKNDNRLPS